MIPVLLSLTLLAAAGPGSGATAGYYTAKEAQALFAEGNQAFAQDDYPKARAAFERLLAHGYGGADVHYNLGTVELAQADLGHAVLDLLRARREGGAAQDVEANLALARAKQLDKVIGAQLEDSVWVNMAQQTSSRAVGFTFLIAWLLAFAALLARRLLRGARFALGAVCAGAFTVAAVTGTFLAFQAYLAQARVEAVVVDKTLPAHDLPDAEAKVAFEVHAGLEVRLGEQVGTFVRIRLPNGLEGWAPHAGLEPL
jgi:tetratricopeptide (TPR) repeat protein